MTMVETLRKHWHCQAIRSAVFAMALAWLAFPNGVVLTSQPLDGAPMEYHPVGGQSFRLQSDAGKPWLDAAFDMDGTRVTFNWPKDQWTGATVMTALIRKERTDPELVLLVRNGVDEIGASDSKAKDTEYSMPIRGSGGFSTVRFNVPTPGNKATWLRVELKGKRAAFLDPTGKLRIEIRPPENHEVAGPGALWMKAAGKPVLLFRAFGADGKPTGGDEYLMP